MKKFADWSQTELHTDQEKPDASKAVVVPPGGAGLPPPRTEKLGLNLSYTINLNLPATSDVAVFNAIFKSLKENMLKGSEDEVVRLRLTVKDWFRMIG